MPLYCESLLRDVYAGPYVLMKISRQLPPRLEREGKAFMGRPGKDEGRKEYSGVIP